MTAISLAAAMRDPNLLGRAFQAPSFWTWHCVAKVLSGEKLDERETALFCECTGRTKLPARRIRRLILLAGRRAGKDRFTSAVAVHQAALAADWRKIMSLGEQAVVILVGADRKQAKILRRYCEGLLEAPLLAAEVVRSTDEVIEFRNGAALEVITNDVSLVRGRSAIAICGSEACHWPVTENSASNDEEVVSAAEPAMAMTPGGGLLLMQSSVRRKTGYMYRMFKELHGNDDAEDAICWLATSRTMNPVLPEEIVASAISRDGPRGAAEYNSLWRDDLATYLGIDLLEAAVDRGVTVRPPKAGTSYRGHVDGSSGAGKDSYAVVIGHTEGDEIIIDVAHERRPPFNPHEAVAEGCRLLLTYGCASVHGDKFSAGFMIEGHARNGVKYEYCERDTSSNYLEALPLFTSGRVRLVDSRRLLSQFSGLERRTSVTGRDRVDHGVGDQHDDLSAACAGCLAELSLDKRPGLIDEAALTEQYGAPLELPKRGGIRRIIAAIGEDKAGNVAVTYCGLTRIGLPYDILVLDVFAAPFRGGFFADVENRVIGLQREWGAGSSVICAAGNLRAHIDEERVEFAEMPERFSPEASLVPVADWISKGKVKISADCMAKARNSDFGPALLHFRAGDPVASAAQISFIAAICGKLDSRLA